MKEEANNYIILCSSSAKAAQMAPSVQLNCAKCGKVIYVSENTLHKYEGKRFTLYCIECGAEKGEGLDMMPMDDYTAEKLKELGMPEDLLEIVRNAPPELVLKFVVAMNQLKGGEE